MPGLIPENLPKPTEAQVRRAILKALDDRLVTYGSENDSGKITISLHGMGETSDLVLSFRAKREVRELAGGTKVSETVARLTGYWTEAREE